MTHLLRDLLTDPHLLHIHPEPRPAVEWEAQEWCPDCERYVPELICGVCLPCLEGQDSEENDPL